MSDSAHVIFRGTNATLIVQLPRAVVDMATTLSKRECTFIATEVDDAYMLEILDAAGRRLELAMAARDDDRDCERTAEKVIRSAFENGGTP